MNAIAALPCDLYVENFFAGTPRPLSPGESLIVKEWCALAQWRQEVVAMVGLNREIIAFLQMVRNAKMKFADPDFQEQKENVRSGLSAIKAFNNLKTKAASAKGCGGNERRF